MNVSCLLLAVLGLQVAVMHVNGMGQRQRTKNPREIPNKQPQRHRNRSNQQMLDTSISRLIGSLGITGSGQTGGNRLQGLVRSVVEPGGFFGRGAQLLAEWQRLLQARNQL